MANLANTKCCKNPWKMTETLANGYSYESTQWELSNEYQHDRVSMVFKRICSCALDESIPISIGRVKWNVPNNSPLTLSMLRLLSWKAQERSNIQNPFFNPAMLVFNEKLMLSSIRWVHICQVSVIFQLFSHHFLLAKLATSSTRVKCMAKSITYADDAIWETVSAWKGWLYPLIILRLFALLSEHQIA